MKTLTKALFVFFLLAAFATILVVGCKEEFPTALSISSAPAWLEQGKEVTLTATGYRLKDPVGSVDVSWSSSKPSVATVDASGKVKGVSSGSVIITARSKTDSKESATRTIRVYTPATLLSFSSKNPPDTSIMLEEGASQRLTPNRTPASNVNADLIWSSSDTRVVGVDTGVVKAGAAGRAVVTARVPGQNGVSASIDVIVTRKAVSVTLISFGQRVDQGKPLEILIAQGEKRTLRPTLAPSNATSADIIWASSDETMAKVSPTGEVTGEAEGVALVTATSKGNAIVADTVSIRVYAPSVGPP